MLNPKPLFQTPVLNSCPKLLPDGHIWQRRLNHTAAQSIGYLVKDNENRYIDVKGTGLSSSSEQGFKYRKRNKGAQGI